MKRAWTANGRLQAPRTVCAHGKREAGGSANGVRPLPWQGRPVRRRAMTVEMALVSKSAGKTPRSDTRSLTSPRLQQESDPSELCLVANGGARPFRAGVGGAVKPRTGPGARATPGPAFSGRIPRRVSARRSPPRHDRPDASCRGRTVLRLVPSSGRAGSPQRGRLRRVRHTPRVSQQECRRR